MAALTERTIERSFGRCFDLFTPERKIFSCVGEISHVATEIDVLRNAFGWKEGNSLTEATGIFFSIPNSDADTIDKIIATTPKAAFVFLAVEWRAKKNQLVERLERHGYRILFERGNVTYLTDRRTEPEVLKEGLSLGDEEVVDFLRQSWRRVSNLPKETPVDFISAVASDLLTPKRFDIAIKALYGRLWSEGRALNWRDFAYFEQGLRVTGPGDDISERDGTGKSGIGQFRTAFHSLLRELDPNDVPAVPVDGSWTAFDGAHRIAAAIVMNRRVHVARIESPSKCLASATFLAGTTHGHPPCPAEILDEAAIEYCRVKQGLALALIFPTAASEKFAINSLSRAGSIVYRKDIDLSPHGGGALLRQAYFGHAWLQDESKDSGFASKLKSCFPFRGTVRVVLIDECEPNTLRSVKERIRSHYGVGNHSIHITDGDEEVLRLARVLFNQNSIDLLLMGIGELPRFHKMIFAYRDWLEHSGLDEEAVCIDGSAILALLGLRECRDIDFLFHGEEKALPAPPSGIDCHNDFARYHHHAIPDLVGDPRLHCWYMGIKFCTPHLVSKMKERRNEAKDRADVILLRSKLLMERPHWINSLLVKRIRAEGYMRARASRLLQRIKGPLRPIVRAIRRRRS